MNPLNVNHRKAPKILVILVLAFVIAACGGVEAPTADIQADEEVSAGGPIEIEKMENNEQVSEARVAVNANFEVRPIEEVFSNGPPELIDLTDADATLIFISDIPLACSVVYGKTTDYGLLTLDQDMNGGAHTDHHPFISGLEPDTVYHYRLQGSAEDGTIYMSQDMTFRTPPAEATTEVDLASLEAGAQVIAVSSNFGGAANDESWGANSALDGSRGTEWSSNGDGNEAFIEVALARPAHLHTVEVWTRTMSNGTAQIFEFTLTTDAGQVLGPFTLDDAEQAYHFDVDVTASTLRLDVLDSNGGNTGLVEFAAFGTPLDPMNIDDAGNIGGGMNSDAMGN